MIEDFERKKEKFRYFPRLPSGGRFLLGSRPPASRYRRELLAMKSGNRADVSLMSGVWIAHEGVIIIIIAIAIAAIDACRSRAR